MDGEKRERQRDRETERQRDKETRRQGDKETERRERESERKIEREKERLRVSTPMGSHCHACIMTTHLSYRFPISEASATAFCGTTGMHIMVSQYVCSPGPPAQRAQRTQRLRHRSGELPNGILKETWIGTELSKFPKILNILWFIITSSCSKLSLKIRILLDKLTSFLGAKDC
jgi:hypothetical protein